MGIRAIVFDIGGILEVTPEGLEPGTRFTKMILGWERRLGLDRGTLAERLASMREAGATGRCTEAEWHASLCLKDDERALFLADMWNGYLGAPNEPLVAWLRAQRPKYKTALLSNSFVGAREKEEERYAYSSLVDDIVYSHEVGIEKPDRRIYELTWERLGVAPTEMLFLDDVAANIDAARALGIHAVLFENNEQAIPALEHILG
jgi:putative hydrolase of the HAD superfamily